MFNTMFTNLLLVVALLTRLKLANIYMQMQVRAGECLLRAVWKLLVSTRVIENVKREKGGVTLKNNEKFYILG